MRAGLTAIRFPFLGKLTTAGQRELGALATQRAAAKRHLLRRGDAVNGAFLVSAGSLRVYYISAEGREATLYHVEPGGTCILALASTFNDEPYPAWVDAGPEGVQFSKLPAPALRRLLGSEDAFRAFVFGAMSGRLFELMRTLEEARSQQLEQRLARHLVARHAHAADGVIRSTQVALAAELGTAREVVFRALRSLARRELITTQRMQIRVRDLGALTSFAAGR